MNTLHTNPGRQNTTSSFVNRSHGLKALTVLFLAIFLTACGGSAVAMADLPAYPNAVELKAGESTVGDTLKNNMAQDASIRAAAGAGGKTEQKGYKLPADADWDKVKAFYTDKLKAAGWSEGLGGIGGGIANNVMSQVNVANDMFQTQMFSKGKQVLTVIRVVDPVQKDHVELILSLTTN